jgi:hypothetical protein
MIEIRRGVPLFLVLAATSCNVPSDTFETEVVEGDLTSGATYYLKLPKMIGDTGNCVAIAGSSLSDKAFAVEWDCNGSKNEQFVAESVGSGYYRLRNVNSGKCLNVYSGALDAAHTKTGNQDGALVQQYTCGSGDNNYWQFVAYNGYYKIVSKLHTGDGKYRCLDIRGGDSTTANGTSVEIWTCGASGSTKGNQTFNPTLVGSGGTGGSGGSGSGGSGGTGGGGSGGSGTGGGGSGGSGGTGGGGSGGTGGGGSGGTGGAGTGGGGGSDPCTAPNLVWKTAKKTWYTSYPDPGSEECIRYNGCMWAGQFQACPGVKPEAWVSAHNIAAFFPLGSMAKHNICIKSATKTMVVTVIDTCGDSDCSGCCTKNKGTADALIDLESYTNERFGVQDGPITWADLGLNANACD